MLILGMDTSTACGSVALASECELIAEYNLSIEKTHSTRLLPVLKQLLDDTNIALDQVDIVAVTQGPGSFTGLRIGIAVAKALAFALNRPLVGIPTLDVLAHNVPYCHISICPIIDARKSQVFAAFYTCTGAGTIIRCSEYLCITPDELLARLDGPVLLLGTGAVRYEALLTGKTAEAFLAVPELHYPRAAVLCRLALSIWKEKGGVHPRDLRAIYLRPSDAELARMEQTGHQTGTQS